MHNKFHIINALMLIAIIEIYTPQTSAIDSPQIIQSDFAINENNKNKNNQSSEYTEKQADLTEKQQPVAAITAKDTSSIVEGASSLMTTLMSATTTSYEEATTVNEQTMQGSTQCNCTIIQESISLEDVDADLDCARFNSNNHWLLTKKKEIPKDYAEVIERTYVRHWINLKGKKGVDFEVFKLKDSTIKNMVDATKLHYNTGRLSSTFKDDMEYDIATYYKSLDQQLKNKKCFVRTDLASLKTITDDEGKLKVYNNAYDLFLDLPKASIGHNPILPPINETMNINIYLFPWVDIDADKEFRVFVSNNKVTAISQQELYRKNNLLLNLGPIEKKEQINQWCREIIKFINETVVPEIKNTSYTVDLAMISGDKDDQIYFIEINPFGKDYTSGSALFHWQVDNNILCGNNGDSVTFRYVE